MSKKGKDWSGIDTTRMRHYWFERAELESKYPGVIEKLQKKYTKLSDFY